MAENVVNMFFNNSLFFFSVCCIHNDVRDSCLHICSFDIDLYVLMEMTPDQQGECLQDSDKMIACLAGNTH